MKSFQACALAHRRRRHSVSLGESCEGISASFESENSLSFFGGFSLENFDCLEIPG